MEYQVYLDKMKEIQIQFLEFLEREDNTEENYSHLIKLIEDKNIKDDKHELKQFLCFISRISRDHHRNADFFSKIGRILKNYQNEITNFFTNIEMFDIFERSLSILLFLIDEKIMIFDQSIFHRIINIEKIDLKKAQHIFSSETFYLQNHYDYISFFQPEIEQFIKSNKIEQSIQFDQKISEDFYEKRKIGENDNYLSEVIRKDKIEEFIIYINKKDLSLNSEIERSIFETNSMLLRNSPTLIEYAAFFGSVQIFKYLYKNNVELTKTVFIYAIHGDDAEIIQILVENIGSQMNNEQFNLCLKESIQCHHNNITEYITNNFINDENVSNDNLTYLQRNLIQFIFHYYNFNYMPSQIYYDCYPYLLRYNYYNIIEHLFKSKEFDFITPLKINDKQISFNFILIIFLFQLQPRKIVMKLFNFY